jgi:glycosyltransferase involved in cell wall biosynthesis
MVERVVVVSDDSAASGGAALMMRASIRLLRGRGVPVTLITGDAGDDPELQALGVTVVPLVSQNINEGWRPAAAVRGIYDGRNKEILARWIDRHDTPGTAYHLHNWHKVLSPAVFAPLRRVASRLFMTAHDYFLVCPNGGFLHYPKKLACERTPMSAGCISAQCDKRHYAHKLWRVARGATLRRIFDFSDTEATVIAVHDGMVPYLVRGGIARQAITVLRNPVMPWTDVRVRSERNHELFFVGRLEEDKGVRLLAEAAKRAGVALRVVGDGPLRPTLERQYPDVLFAGKKSRSELQELVTQARMLAVPTRWRETFGLVALEAAMSGIPIIVSTLALISREIVQSGSGIACDPHDQAALAKAIRDLAGNDLKVRTMSEAAFTETRKLAPTTHAWCDDLLALYEAKLAGRLAA